MALTASQKQETHDALIAVAVAIETAALAVPNAFGKYMLDEDSNITDPIFNNDQANTVAFDGRNVFLRHTAEIRWLAAQFS